MTDPDESFRTRLRRGVRNLRAGPRTWLVLLGNRLVLAGLLTALFGAIVVATLFVAQVRLDAQTQLLYVFQAIVGGNLTLVTIVLSINQLILSREFNTPGELRERIEGTEEYREGVRETVGTTGLPVTPTPFLDELVGATRETAERLVAAARELGDGPSAEDDVGDDPGAEDGPGDELEALAGPVAERAAASSQRLESSTRSTFAALVVVLETNYSQPLSDAQRLQRKHGDDLPADVAEDLAALVRTLRHVDIARQYFKSIYMQSELARLSQLLLWVGVPAIGSAAVLLFAYAAGAPDAVPPPTVRALVVPVLVLGFLPLAVLFAFVLRIATVAQRTVSITPFTTAPQEQVLEEDEGERR